MKRTFYLRRQTSAPRRIDLDTSRSLLAGWPRVRVTFWRCRRIPRDVCLLCSCACTHLWLPWSSQHGSPWRQCAARCEAQGESAATSQKVRRDAFAHRWPHINATHLLAFHRRRASLLCCAGRVVFPRGVVRTSWLSEKATACGCHDVVGRLWHGSRLRRATKGRLHTFLGPRLSYCDICFNGSRDCAACARISASSVSCHARLLIGCSYKS
jgi:hypothetical protein